MYTGQDWEVKYTVWGVIIHKGGRARKLTVFLETARQF